MNSRKRLLSTAAGLIHTKGFNNTSVQDILEEASVVRSNFYYHFDSKEQLGFEVLARQMHWWYGYVVRPSLDNLELSPAERINAMLDKVALIGTSEAGAMGCPFGNLAQELSYIHEPFRETLSNFFGGIARRLEECIDEGKKEGVFKDTPPSQEIAEFAIAQIQGSFLLRKTHKDPGIMERNIEMLRQIVQNNLQSVI
jgi:TetR/AcrR family transcriptional repressor of nem operon